MAIDSGWRWSATVADGGLAARSAVPRSLAAVPGTVTRPAACGGLDSDGDRRLAVAISGRVTVPVAWIVGDHQQSLVTSRDRRIRVGSRGLPVSPSRWADRGRR